jgi:hypothetical protein
MDTSSEPSSEQAGFSGDLREARRFIEAVVDPVVRPAAELAGLSVIGISAGSLLRSGPIECLAFIDEYYLAPHLRPVGHAPINERALAQEVVRELGLPANVEGMPVRYVALAAPRRHGLSDLEPVGAGA